MIAVYLNIPLKVSEESQSQIEKTRAWQKAVLLINVLFFFFSTNRTTGFRKLDIVALPWQPGIFKMNSQLVFCQPALILNTFLALNLKTECEPILVLAAHLHIHLTSARGLVVIMID